eukprot:gene738-2519_t
MPGKENVGMFLNDTTVFDTKARAWTSAGEQSGILRPPP